MVIPVDEYKGGIKSRSDLQCVCKTGSMQTEPGMDARDREASNKCGEREAGRPEGHSIRHRAGESSATRIQDRTGCMLAAQ